MKLSQKIKTMREIGHILSEILDELEQMVEPNLSTMKLEERFLSLCGRYKVNPACKGYTGKNNSPFPTGLCVGINSDCVHCYPSENKTLKEGDIVVIDTVIERNGYYVDSARTVGVGEISDERKKLINVTIMARSAAINVIKDGIRVGDISNAIQTIAEMSGFDVLRGYTGHGVGDQMHEPPNIPCYGGKGTGDMIREGMTLAIEPLIVAGDPEVENVPGDDWQTEIVDGSDFCQFEHTVLVKKDGCDILTK